MARETTDTPKLDSRADARQDTLVDSDALAETEADALGQTAPMGEERVDQIVGDNADGFDGQRLAHFELLATIGEGGMGTVWRARDVSLDRIVALKLLPKDIAKPLLIDRFKREARSQARLSHPNVVPIYFIGEQSGQHFFAMELVEGASLDSYGVAHERLEWTRAVDYMVDVAKALRQAHQRGLIHRDLKPGNLLVTPQNNVKVADFGLAKPIEEGDGQLTEQGSFVGTPLYIAPEQAQGEQVDHRADMYALGATFFHLIVGEPVFSAPTPVAMVVKHVSEPAPAIADVAGAIPGRLAQIIDRLLAKNPGDRFADYDDLLDALQAARPRADQEAGFLVRSASFGIDISLMMATMVVSSYAPIVIYPLYFIASWAVAGHTIGQRLFRLRVVTDDGSALSLWEAVKRFSATHWGAFAAAAVAAIVSLGFGITEFSMTEHTFEHLNDPTIQIISVASLALTITGVAWLLGALMCIFHPRKRAAHDLLTRTKVIYHFNRES